MQTKFYLMMSLLIFQLAACTRAVKEDLAKVSIALPSTLSSGPSAAGAANLEIAHVAINATGAGIAAPIVYSWDSCHDCQSPPPPPTSFTLDVPSGTARLIQILAVYKDTATEQMVFYYGDSTSDLKTAEVTLDIAILPVGQGAITSGRASGRYLSTATSGPTGIIDIKYSPGNGKPALILERGAIVNGWFNLFMLSGASLQYVLRNTGEMLWGQEMSFESAAMNPAESSGAYFDQRVRAYLPVHIRVDQRDGVINYYPQEAETFVWGYWGPGAVGKKVCTSGLDSSPVPQRLKRYASSNLSSSPPLSVSHYINFNLAVPTKAELNDTTNPYSTIVVQGGSNMSSSCDSFADTATNQYSNFQKVTLDLFDGNGSDNVAGFRGIFRGAGSGNFVNISNTDPKNISGQVLPGVEAVFNGLRLYKRLGPEDLHMDAPLCAELAAGAKGFVPGSTTDAVIGTDGNFTLSSNISAAEASSGVSAVLCPVYNGTLAPLGIFLGKWMFGSYGGGSGGGSSGPATQLATVMFGNKVANFTCTPFFVEARDANNHPAYFNGSMDLTFTLDNGDTLVYSDPYCSSPITNPYSTNSPNQMFYLKSTASGAVTRNLTVASSLPALNQSLSFVDATGTAFVMARVQPNISAYGCYTAAYVFMLQNGSDKMVATPGASYSINLPNTSGLNFYNPSGSPCSGTATNTVNLSSSNLVSFINFSYSGTGTSISLNGVSANYTVPGGFSGGSPISVTQPGPATAVRLAMPNSFAAESCVSGNLQVVDSMNNPAPAPQAISLSFTYNGSGTPPANAGFYTDNTCTTLASAPSIAASTTQSPQIYFRWTTSEALTINATISSGPAGMSFQPYTGNVGP